MATILDTDLQVPNRIHKSDMDNKVKQITSKAQNIIFSQSDPAKQPIYNYDGYFEFDGVDDLLDGGSTNSFRMGINKCIESYVYLPVGADWLPSVFSKLFSNILEYNIGFTYISGTPRVQIIYKNNKGSNTVINTYIELLEDRWYHIVFGETLNGCYVLVDGVCNGFILSNSDSVPNSTVRIGFGRSNSYFKGNIKYIKMHDHNTFNIPDTPILGTKYISFIDTIGTTHIKRYKEDGSRKLFISSRYLENAVIDSNNNIQRIYSSLGFSFFEQLSLSNKPKWSDNGILFDSGQYLEKAISTDYNFGTTDFFLGRWINFQNESIAFEIGSGTIRFGLDNINAYIETFSGKIYATNPHSENEGYKYYSIHRINGTIYIAINGILENSRVENINYNSNQSAKIGGTFIGYYDDGFDSHSTEGINPTGYLVGEKIFEPPTRGGWTDILKTYNKEPEPLVMTLRTTTTNEIMSLTPITNSSSLYKFIGIIDWGDGTGELEFNGYSHSNLSHIYSNPGYYDVQITGLFEYINIGVTTAHRTKYIAFKKFGTVNLKSFVVNYAINLNQIPNDGARNAKTIQNFQSAFQYRTSITNWGDVSDWDMQNAISVQMMFSGCTNFNQPINWKNTNNIQTVALLFYGCASFNQPVILDLSSCTTLYAMFSQCDIFDSSILLSNTYNVDTTRDMFWRCYDFNKPVELDTLNVTDMRNMFYQCYSFNHPVEFDTANVTNMQQMFDGCNVFNQDVSYYTSNVTTMYNMFNNCYLFNKPIEFDTKKVTDMSNMFANCNNFNQPISFDSSIVTSMSSMFSGCYVLDSSIILDTHNTINMSGMFRSCNLYNQPVEFNTSNSTSMSGMFLNCYKFNKPVVFDTSNVTNMSNMFGNCYEFNQLVDFDTSEVTNMSSMFLGCNVFNKPVVFDTSKTTLMTNMFTYCYLFDNSVNFDTSNVTNTSSMFKGCSTFNQPVVFDTSNVTDINNMFELSLNFNKPINFSIPKVVSLASLFADCSTLNSNIILSDSSILTSATSTFLNCKSFNSDVSLNGSKLTNVTSMFQGCNNFDKPINFGVTTLLTNMNNMLRYCPAFNNNSLSLWNISNVSSIVNFMSNSNLSPSNYDDILVAWEQLDLVNGRSINFGASKYTTVGQTAKNLIIAQDNWTFSDGGLI